MAKGPDLSALVKAALDPFADKLTSTLTDGISKAFAALNNVVPAMAVQWGSGLGNAMKTVTEKALAPLSLATGVYAAAAGQASQMILGFVSKANPAAALGFNQALDDLAATMGQILLPVMQAVQIVVRTVADVFQALRPALDPVMQSFKQLFGTIAELAAPIASLLLPMITLFGNEMQSIVIPAVKIISELLQTAIGLVVPLMEEWYGVMTDYVLPAIKTFLTYLLELAKMLKSALGIKEFEYTKGASQGAAVRGASYGGGIEDIGKRTTLAALNVGHAQINPNAKLEENTAKTNDILKGIDEFIRSVNSIGKGIGTAVDAGRHAASEAGNFLLSPGFYLAKQLAKQVRDR
jgi:hypothetical protein